MGIAAGIPIGSAGPDSAARLDLPGSQISKQLAGQRDQIKVSQSQGPLSEGSRNIGQDWEHIASLKVLP